MICFVDMVGFRDRICLVDRVGFRDRICFVDMVGFVGWKQMDTIKLNQNKSKPATKLNLEHELRTADSKTELCKAKAMVLGRNKLIVIIFWLFVDYGTKQN
jgi:aminoglycoside phosphotransferase family enzyme